MSDLKQGVEHIEQSVKDAAAKVTQGAKVDQEKAGEHVRDTSTKTRQDVKQVGDKI